MILYKDNPFNIFENLGANDDIEYRYVAVLETLDMARHNMPNETWDSYPKSALQYNFYKFFLNCYPDYFSDHPSFDYFNEKIEDNFDAFLYRDEQFLKKIGLFPMTQSNKDYYNFALNIEKRARNYTAPLVKIGFLSEDRYITPAGYDYMRGRPFMKPSLALRRDPLEMRLPLDDGEIVLLRQIAKLRIFSRTDINGNLVYYSPFNNLINSDIPSDDEDENGFNQLIRNLIMFNPYNKGKITNPVPEREILSRKYDKNELSDILGETEEVNEILWGFYNLLYKMFIGCWKGNILDPLEFQSSQKRRSIFYLQLRDYYFENHNIINKYLFAKDKIKFGTKKQPYSLEMYDKQNTKDNKWFSSYIDDFDSNKGFNRFFLLSYFNSSAERLIKNDGRPFLELLERLDLLYVFMKDIRFEDSKEEDYLEGDTLSMIKEYLEKEHISLKVFNKMDADKEYEGGVYSYFSRNQSLMDILSDKY